MPEPREHICKVVRRSDAPKNRHAFCCLDKNERIGDFTREFWHGLVGSIRQKDVYCYPDLGPFYQKLARWIGLPQQNILLTSGADAAVRTVYEVYGRVGGTVVLPSPSYAMYGVYADMHGMQQKRLPFNEQLKISAGTIVDALSRDDHLLLIANPNSPMGSMLSIDELDGIVSASQRHDIMVLIDEAYYYFTEQTAVGLLDRYRNLVLARTFSKAAGLAGVRLGVLLGHEETIGYLSRVKPLYEINGIALRMGEYMMEHDDRIWQYARDCHEGKRYLADACRQMGLHVFESHTNFINVRMPNPAVIPGILERLRDAGYLIQGAYPGSPLRHCIRITIGPTEYMAGFLAAFKPIVNSLR